MANCPDLRSTKSVILIAVQLGVYVMAANKKFCCSGLKKGLFSHKTEGSWLSLIQQL